MRASARRAASRGWSMRCRPMHQPACRSSSGSCALLLAQWRWWRRRGGARSCTPPSAPPQVCARPPRRRRRIPPRPANQLAARLYRRGPCGVAVLQFRVLRAWPLCLARRAAGRLSQRLASRLLRARVGQLCLQRGVGTHRRTAAAQPRSQAITPPVCASGMRATAPARCWFVVAAATAAAAAQGWRFSVSSDDGTGRRVRWLGWEAHVTLLAASGLALHDVTFRGARIAFEISVQDMFVAYR